jgi:hypothetical protein
MNRNTNMERVPIKDPSTRPEIKPNDQTNHRAKVESHPTPTPRRNAAIYWLTFSRHIELLSS